MTKILLSPIFHSCIYLKNGNFQDIIHLFNQNPI